MVICRNCQANNPDEARFCQNCGQALARICTNCGAENAAAANFCMNCGNSLGKIDQAQPLPAKTPLPVEEKAERRIVTVLFCDVVGSTALSEQLDPETWTEIMNGVFERTIAAVRRYDGTVDRMLGDAIMAIFGAPIAFEDDPYRAVLAALRIIQDLRPYQEQIRSELAQEGINFSSQDFEVRIGINTGLVVVSQVGVGKTRKWTPLGDTVNLAARMEQAAQPGTIWITNNTYRQVAPFIEAADLGSLQVKGKQDQVQAYQVLQLKEQPTRAIDLEQLESPLIAREREIHLLRESLHRLQEGEGQILCLLGEAGLGKSRLLQELKTGVLDKVEDSKSKVANITWYESESLSFETSQPYGLIRKLLRQIANIKRDDNPDTIRKKIEKLLESISREQLPQLRRSLGVLFGLEGEGHQPYLWGEDIKPELFESVLILVKAWASMKPMVLVFEDLHWADPASVELLVHLFLLVDQHPLLLLCLFRPDRQSSAWTVKEMAERRWSFRYQEIVLEPLSAQESDALVGGLLNVPGLPERLGSLILEKTEGVPIFIEEIVRELIESQLLVLSEDGRNWQLGADLEEITIPDSLESVLVARMDRLEEGTRRTLQLAAVIGRSFHYPVLRMITAGDGQLDDRLRSLQQAGMIREVARIPEREFIFKHVLSQEAAYNTILLKERRLYHQQVGDVMEQIFADRLDELAPLLAHHFHQGGDYTRALSYYSLAAANAARLFANEEAVTHYTAAIKLADRSTAEEGQQFQLHRGRGMVYETLGNFDGAHADHEAALRSADSDGDLKERWRSLLDLGKLWASRDYRITRDYYNQALELARRLGDPVVLARTLNRIGNWHNNAENLVEAEKYHQEALKIFEELGDARGVASTLDLLAVLNTFRGNATMANAYYERASGLFREIDDLPGLASCLATRSNILVPYLGCFNEAGSTDPLDKGINNAKEAIEIATRIGRRSDESLAHWPLELLYAAQGRYGLALVAEKRGLKIAKDIAHGQFTIAHLLGLGYIYNDLLLPEESVPHCEKGLFLAREVASSSWINQAAGLLARAYILMDDLDQAEACLISTGTAELPMDTMSRRDWWISWAKLARARGDALTALDIVDKVIASVEELMPGCKQSDAWRLRGQALMAIERPDEAEATLLAAQEHAQMIGERSQLWRIQADFGHLYGIMKRDSEAEKAIGAARKLVAELADTIPDKELRNIFFRRASEKLTSESK